ncbi:MAG: hypothetical protein NUW37_13825 [Planctomycetes bacterium]|nr:hypothetical protein [Planctomycetota bacterium]
MKTLSLQTLSSGGGKKGFARAGGKDADKLEAALEAFKTAVRELSLD